MDLSAPYRALLSKDMGGVLWVLAGTNEPLTGRQVARLAHGAHSTVARILGRLVVHGIVRDMEAGASRLYSLNRDHVLAEPILAFVRVHARFHGRLLSEFERWDPPPHHVSLFGSAARGDGDADSDIDLFIVRPNGVDEDHPQWRTQLDALPTRILDWTGNRASVAEVPESDLSRLARERTRVASDIRRDAVTLLGPQAREVLTESTT